MPFGPFLRLWRCGFRGIESSHELHFPRSRAGPEKSAPHRPTPRRAGGDLGERARAIFLANFFFFHFVVPCNLLRSYGHGRRIALQRGSNISWQICGREGPPPRPPLVALPLHVSGLVA